MFFALFVATTFALAAFGVGAVAVAYAIFTEIRNPK